jgi:hypothetical protein
MAAPIRDIACTMEDPWEFGHLGQPRQIRSFELTHATVSKDNAERYFIGFLK